MVLSDLISKWLSKNNLADSTTFENHSTHLFRLMHPAKVSTHQSQRTLTIFCAHSEIKQIQERLEEAAQRLKNWAQLTAEQLKKASVWMRVITHILLNHHTIGAGDSRAPPALTTAT